MIQFAADFESSKEIVYKTPKVKSKALPAYRVVEEDIVKDGVKKKVKSLKNCEWYDRTVDREKSKTWVYLWGIETLDMSFYKVGYSIDSFMEFILNYTDEMRIYFHNEKFDGSFILYWLLQHPRYKQLLPEGNKFCNDFFKDNPDKHILFEFFDDSKSSQVEKYFKAVGMIDKKGICQEDGVYFQSSVNNMGIMYSIKIYVFKSEEPLHKIEIFDSYKLLSFSIDTLGKEFLNEKDFEKEEYNYEIVRLENRPDLLTDKDFSYLKRDIDILAKSMTLLRMSKNIVASADKQTTASLALDEFKTLWYEQVTGKQNPKPKQKDRVFREVFPVLSEQEDSFVREGYKGGFCYAHPYIKGKLLTSEKGMCVIDVNSLFPSVMLKNPMPWGWPLFSSKDKIEIPNVGGVDFDYYFTRVRVNFRVKDKHIPSIMLKGTDMIREFNSNSGVKSLPLNKYLESSQNFLVELVLSKDDYELMHQQYDVFEEYIAETYYFKTLIGIFDKYITKWGQVKIDADKEGNQTERQIAKLFLNSLYGKFGAKPINVFKFFEMVDGVLTMHPTDEKIDKPVYVPVAAAITAGGRRKTIEASQKILDYGFKKYNDVMYCYSDTDSIHTRLSKEEVIECLGEDIDTENTKELGLWALEETDIIKSKFLRAKSYLEERAKPNKKGKILASGCAGLPSDIQEFLTFDSFESSSIFVGKLSPIQVQGGLALVEDKFTLKED